jgi:SulP family sulfate permease
MVQQLRQGGVLIEPETEACRSFPDLDRAMEWCENQILAASKYRRQRILPLPLQLNTWLADADAATHLMQILEDVPIQAGDTLFQQGDAPNYLYFLQSGQVDTLSGEGQTINRYQTLGPGTLFGDVEFYTRMSYELSARVEQSGRLYRLSQAAWDRLQQDDPRTAAIFSRWISTLLAERLQQSRREVAALLR